MKPFRAALTFHDVVEGAVPIVVIENVLPEVSQEQIVVAVVVVVTNRDAVAPAGVVEAGLFDS